MIIKGFGSDKEVYKRMWQGKFYADIGSVVFDSTERTAASTCSACGGECFPKSFKDGTSGSQCQVCGSTFGGNR